MTSLSVYLLVVLTGFAGSFHCGVMCGPFAVLARAGSLRGMWAYQAGRLMAYLVLGAVAGFLGQRVLFASVTVGLQQVALVGMGLAMILAGLSYYLPAPLRSRWSGPLGRFIRSLTQGVQGSERAALLGLLTTLLPCGYLYAYALAALGTADPLRGVATMAAFWLGTTPALLGVGLASSLFASRAPAWLRQLTPILLILLGLLALAGKWAALPSGPDQDIFCITR